MINLDKLYPDWQKAQLHGKSTKPGITQHQKILQHIQICPCCLNQIQKQPIAYCESTKKLQSMGIGFPLFYNFLKNCILLVTVFIFSYSALSLYWSLTHNFDFFMQQSRQLASSSANDSGSTTGCFSFMIYFARIENTLNSQEIFLRTISFILHMLVLIFIKNKNRHLQEYFYERTNLISDYSIVIKGLPNTKGIKLIIQSFFTKQFGSDYQINHFTYAPLTYQLTQLQKQEKNLIKKRNLQQKKIINENNELQNKQLKQIKQQIQKKQKQIYNLCSAIQTQIYDDSVICQKVIVSFSKEQQKQQILKTFPTISKQQLKPYFGDISHIEVESAPQPRQIIWQNYHITYSQRVIRTIIGWILSIMFVGLITIGFYFLLQAKSKILAQYFSNYNSDPQKFRNDRNKGIFLVFLTMVFVILFNKFFMSHALHWLAVFQKHQNKSQQQFSFAIKYSFGMFFTTALMTLAVQAFRFKNYLTHEFGVIEQQSIMFFLNSFFVPLIWLINPIYIFKLIKRKINYGKETLTQRQANKLMEDPYYDLGKRYAQILQTLWFTFLYSTIVPLGSFLTWIGLILYYNVDKFNLIYRSSIDGNVSGKLNQIGMILLDFTLLFTPAGEILFDQHLRKASNNFSIILLLSAFVFILFPWNLLITKLFSKKQKIIKKTYKECGQKFLLNYHTYSPIYQQLYLKKLFKCKKPSMALFDQEVLYTQTRIITP